jgi:uncharacterized membrane protein
LVKSRLLLVLAGSFVIAVSACSPRQPDPAPEETPVALDSVAEVAAPELSASVADTRPVPARLRATGTEPFWGASVTGANLVYTTPEYPAGIRVTVIRRDGPGTATFTGNLDGKPLTLTIEQGPCSDGMSDAIYPMTARREIGPDTEQGCAKAGT